MPSVVTRQRRRQPLVVDRGAVGGPGARPAGQLTSPAVADLIDIQCRPACRLVNAVGVMLPIATAGAMMSYADITTLIACYYCCY